MRRIVIEEIAIEHHRYPTLGDYYFERGDLIIKIAEGFSNSAFACMVIHELVELFMCERDSVPHWLIDQFDTFFESRLDVGPEAEPGEDPTCPYRKQHRAAENLERLFADYLGYDWLTYQDEFDSLCRKLDHLKECGTWVNKTWVNKTAPAESDPYQGQSTHPEGPPPGRPEEPPEF